MLTTVSSPPATSIPLAAASAVTLPSVSVSPKVADVPPEATIVEFVLTSTSPSLLITSMPLPPFSPVAFARAVSTVSVEAPPPNTKEDLLEVTYVFERTSISDRFSMKSPSPPPSIPIASVSDVVLVFASAEPKVALESPAALSIEVE